jgi:hypothetical protein
VSTHHCDLLKQGAHVLGVACHERPTRVVGRKLGVTNGGHALTPHRIVFVLNGGQGNDGITENRQVTLTELRESLVGRPLQSVVKVVASSRGKPSRHSQISGVRVAMVRGNPYVAKVVQHVPDEGGKTGVVQPVTTKPSVGSQGGVGVVVHLSKIREKRINLSSIEQRQQTKTPNKPRRQQTVNSDSVLTHDDLAQLC